MKPTLYLIRGLPGSGKSTFAKTLWHSGIVSNFIEADDYFYKDGVYSFDASKLKEAHKYCQEITLSHLNDGHSVAVSNTSTTEAEVITYSCIAESVGANFVSIIVENRHGGKNVHNVPDDKIEQMRNRFSFKL